MLALRWYTHFLLNPQITGCISLLDSNRAAGRKFYQYAHTMLPIASVGKLRNLLLYFFLSTQEDELKFQINTKICKIIRVIKNLGS